MREGYRGHVRTILMKKSQSPLYDWRLDPAGPDYMMVHTGDGEEIAGGIGKAQMP